MSNKDVLALFNSFVSSTMKSGQRTKFDKNEIIAPTLFMMTSERYAGNIICPNSMNNLKDTQKNKPKQLLQAIVRVLNEEVLRDIGLYNLIKEQIRNEGVRLSPATLTAKGKAQPVLNGSTLFDGLSQGQKTKVLFFNKLLIADIYKDSVLLLGPSLLEIKQDADPQQGKDAGVDSGQEDESGAGIRTDRKKLRTTEIEKLSGEAERFFQEIPIHIAEYCEDHSLYWFMENFREGTPSRAGQIQGELLIQWLVRKYFSPEYSHELMEKIIEDVITGSIPEDILSMCGNTRDTMDRLKCLLIEYGKEYAIRTFVLVHQLGITHAQQTATVRQQKHQFINRLVYAAKQQKKRFIDKLVPEKPAAWKIIPACHAERYENLLLHTDGPAAVVNEIQNALKEGAIALTDAEIRQLT